MQRIRYSRNDNDFYNYRIEMHKLIYKCTDGNRLEVKTGALRYKFINCIGLPICLLKKTKTISNQDEIKG